MQSGFHRRVRIGALEGEAHELWAIFQTLDTLKGTDSTHAQDFVHGALHPDPRARMSPAEICLHPFLAETRDALLAQRHRQGRESPAEWGVHMEQLRVQTPTAKGRGPEARAVSCACGSPVQGAAEVVALRFCSQRRELPLNCVCQLMPDTSESEGHGRSAGASICRRVPGMCVHHFVSDCSCLCACLRPLPPSCRSMSHI